ncbi:hypothetical protein OEZ85_003403 [Tetradesmus obliquus]|uniref:DOG1 domain-containing protein n=1 Tax=Tetradesmus obliquus TaxID=3088 RepID=A0ABY8UBR7_TETOB|nr:hypothetical protein OEZ85_003403 [Tetradesmus obliquus]
MAHLDLSAAVAASREERLAAWQQVQGRLSLLLRAIEGGAAGMAPPPGGRSAAAARHQLKALISSWAGHVISAHIVSPYEHMSWSVTNMEDLSQRHAPPEHYRHIIGLLRLTAAQQQTIAQGLTVFHELLLSLKEEQTRLQQQMLQLQAAHAPPGAPAGAHSLLQRVETNNWQLSWMICLLNFFISGVLDLPQLCKCTVHSYPWPWWPGPFAEEVLHLYQQQQQQQQQQLVNGQA